MQVVARISGDGRSSSSKTNYVMFTLTLLIPNTAEDQNSNFFSGEDCVSIGVYEGKESRKQVFMNHNFLLFNAHHLYSSKLYFHC